MKRNVTALLLALSMCLSLLSACGSGDKPKTDDPSASGSTPGSVEQKETEPPKESEEPRQEEPQESEEPTQAPSAANPSGAKALALLQEEYKNGFSAEGERPGHTYFVDRELFIYDGVLYIKGGTNPIESAFYETYDLAAKKITGKITLDREYGTWSDNHQEFLLDGKFYHTNLIGPPARNHYAAVCDRNGAIQKISEPVFWVGVPFEKGILYSNDQNSPLSVMSYDLEKIAEIPNPQRDIEHGLKEDVTLLWGFPADGTVYVQGNDHFLYRLNTDTYEWENIGDIPDVSWPVGHCFCGKYNADNNGIYDCITGEYIFEYGELYPPLYASYSHASLSYFGGDKYLGYGWDGSDNNYRWVSLKDGTMSEPLLFPEGKDVTVVSDTYCVYQDQYGWFLWDYNTGVEETITLFER